MTVANTKQENTFVLDTSCVLAYLLPDEKERPVDDKFSEFEENKISFLAPSLLIYEIINGLRSAVIQRRQSLKAAELLLDSFLNMGILFEKVNEKEVFRLALKNNITAYDAAYVWLAKSKKTKLLTLDERLEDVVR
jgi:predicted nucleic acid-binding protein